MDMVGVPDASSEGQVTVAHSIILFVIDIVMAIFSQTGSLVKEKLLMRKRRHRPPKEEIENAAAANAVDSEPEEYDEDNG